MVRQTRFYDENLGGYMSASSGRVWLPREVADELLYDDVHLDLDNSFEEFVSALEDSVRFSGSPRLPSERLVERGDEDRRTLPGRRGTGRAA